MTDITIGSLELSMYRLPRGGIQVSVSGPSGQLGSFECTDGDWRSLVGAAVIYHAALAFGRATHTYDANCSAGDHDDCEWRTARTALYAALEAK